MALIRCPECNKEVSDRAGTCIHCGFPLKESTYNATTVKQTFKESAHMWLFSESDSNLNIECGKCGKIYSFPKKYFSDINNEHCEPISSIICPNCNNGVSAGKLIKRKTKINIVNNSNNILKCKRCGSTSVTIGTRGYSLLWGFIGSGKTTNRCGKCGYTWQP